MVFSQTGLFRKHDFVVSQLKYQTTKTTSLGNSKMWSLFFSPLKLTEILGNLFRLQFFKNQQYLSNVYKIYVKFKNTRSRPHFGKLIRLEINF